MKKLLCFLAVGALAPLAFADPVATTTTTTTTADGTITEYTPGSAFVLKEKSGPVHYRYGKTVTYVTKDGHEIPADEVRTRIKVGEPVHVWYSGDGDNRVIDKVEIDR